MSNVLYNHLKNSCKIISSANLLDFGCGTGLSGEIGWECNLVCYEPIENMRKQALEKGLKVLDYLEFCALPNNYFDYVISSYVFHMGINEKHIDLLANKVKTGGIVIANFYKGINSEYITKLFIENGFCAKELKGCEKRFGYIYEYRKK